MYWGLLRKEENTQRSSRRYEDREKIICNIRRLFSTSNVTTVDVQRGFKPAALKLLPLSSCTALCGWSHPWRSEDFAELTPIESGDTVSSLCKTSSNITKLQICQDLLLASVIYIGSFLFSSLFPHLIMF